MAKAEAQILYFPSPIRDVTLSTMVEIGKTSILISDFIWIIFPEYFHSDSWKVVGAVFNMHTITTATNTPFCDERRVLLVVWVHPNSVISEINASLRKHMGLQKAKENRKAESDESSNRTEIADWQKSRRTRGADLVNSTTSNSRTSS